MVSPDLDIVYLPLKFVESPYLYIPLWIGLYLYKQWAKSQKDYRQDNRIYRLENKISNITKTYPMNIDWIGSPNYTEGRKYYWTWDNFKNGRIGKTAVVDKIIYHWMDGFLAGTDAVFKNPKRQASAHFGVEDNIVHQYVKREDTAWHAGNGKINSESFGIELSANKDHYNVKTGALFLAARPASDESYETAAQLVYFIIASAGKKIDDFQHLPHKMFANTECPGTVNIDRIVNRAREIEAEKSVQGIDQPMNGTPVDAVQAMSGSITNYAPFNTDLSPSQNYNDEVARVQHYLIDKGYLENIPENQFGYYGMKTQTAVDKFQKANGIPRASKFGWWYPATRSKANQQLTISK